MSLWIIATLAAFYIKGLCGFANTLVLTSILGFGTNNVNISPVELVLGYPSNIILTVRNRKLLKPSVFIPLSLLVLAGIIPGALMLKNVDAGLIKLIFGFVVIFLGTEMLMREYKKQGTQSVSNKKQSKLMLAIIGILSGILCGLFGVGALLAAYVGRVSESTDEFKANMSAVFIVENTFRILFYSITGIITLTSLKNATLMLPFMLAGLFLGILSAKHMDDKKVKKLVMVLLILSGIVLVVKNL